MPPGREGGGVATRRLFTRNERLVLWALVAILALLSTLRWLQRRQVLQVFRRGEVLRPVEATERQTPY